MYSHRIWILGLVLTLVWGCATTPMSRGQRLLRGGRYDEAVMLFEQVVKDRPQDPNAWTELGVACYRSGKLKRAEAAFQQAQSLDPKNGRAIFFLGMTYEKRKRMDQAIAEYRKYTRFGRLGVLRYQIEARLKALVRQQIGAEVAQAIRDEAQLDVATIPDSTVAVLYFHNAGSRRDLGPLQKGLTDMLITDLSKVSSLQVVERVKLQKLLEEMELGTTGLVDEATAPRVGKLLGAARVVNGAFADLSEDRFRIDAAIAEVKTEQTVHPDVALGALEALFELEKQVAFSVVEEMDIELTRAERDAIQEVPTESLLAFLAYCRGLDYEDRGMSQEAKEAYAEAVRIDPGFAQAQVERKRLSLDRGVIEKAEGDVEGFEEVVEQEMDVMVEGDPASGGRVERLQRIGGHTGMITPVEGEAATGSEMQAEDRPLPPEPSPAEGAIEIEGHFSD